MLGLMEEQRKTDLRLLGFSSFKMLLTLSLSFASVKDSLPITK